MLGYYLNLAVRSLRYHLVLSILIVVVVAVGIGASMTALAIFRIMAGDPIPRKSAQLFTPQIDNLGPAGVPAPFRAHLTSDQLPVTLTYIDAMALMHAHAARRQAAMYATKITVTPPDPQQLPFRIPVRATYADFFAMFAVPFEYGAPWSAADDDAHAPVVVLSRKLNDRLFGGRNSVGRTLMLGTDDYRVAGVIDDWDPVPRFYDVTGDGTFSDPEQIFMPFTLAVQRRLPQDYLSCFKSTGPNILQSECTWVQFWVELPTTAAARGYGHFLQNYAAAQRQSGRFSWPARVALRDVRQWLVYNHVVNDDVRLLVLVSFGFLFVCLLNAMGLMLAKFLRRSVQIATRRALGAARGAIFAQSLVEAGVVGIAGGVAGLGLAVLGLTDARGLFPSTASALTRLDGADATIAVVLGIGATVLAALYPTWRAARLQPAWRLKTR